MTLTLKQLSRYAPLVIGLVILLVIIPLVPWGQVWPYLARLTPLAILGLILASWCYYLGRAVRYWLILRFLNHPVAFWTVLLACLIAEPVAILPAGELYRGQMLRRYGNVAVAKSLPGVFAQGLAEVTGLIIVALVGVAFIHKYVFIVLGIAAVMAVFLLFLHFHSLRRSHHYLNKLPFVSIGFVKFQSFVQHNRNLLSGRNFIALILASYISIAGGIAILYISNVTLGGNLSIFEAGIAYALPTVLETVSFLPGGLGVQEQGTVGILTLFGTGVPLAVALTILVRLFTLGVGFIYGFTAMGVARVLNVKRYD